MKLLTVNKNNQQFDNYKNFKLIDYVIDQINNNKNKETPLNNKDINKHKRKSKNKHKNEDYNVFDDHSTKIGDNHDNIVDNTVNLVNIESSSVDTVQNDRETNGNIISVNSNDKIMIDQEAQTELNREFILSESDSNINTTTKNTKSRIVLIIPYYNLNEVIPIVNNKIMSLNTNNQNEDAIEDLQLRKLKELAQFRRSIMKGFTYK